LRPEGDGVDDNPGVLRLYESKIEKNKLSAVFSGGVALGEGLTEGGRVDGFDDEFVFLVSSSASETVSLGISSEARDGLLSIFPRPMAASRITPPAATADNPVTLL
jgi:hypothetical protein